MRNTWDVATSSSMSTGIHLLMPAEYPIGYAAVQLERVETVCLNDIQNYQTFINYIA